MRCLLCSGWSWKAICEECLDTELNPQPSTRILDEGFKVHSFFAYETISALLHVKHHVHGSRVYTELARVCFAPFIKTIDFRTPIIAVPVDDHIRSGYSHTAILAKGLRSLHVKPAYNVLRAQSMVSYSGKSLAQRKANPRKFTCTLEGSHDIILVDDLITTGLTLSQARKAVIKAGHNPLFALTLASQA